MNNQVALAGKPLFITLSTCVENKLANLVLEENVYSQRIKVEFVSQSEFRLMFHHNINAMVDRLLEDITSKYKNHASAISKLIVKSADEAVYYFTADTSVSAVDSEWLTFDAIQLSLSNS